MENFLFSLNSTIPVFLVIALGWFLRRTGLLNDPFAKTANTYVFKCALPISLFRSIAAMDFSTEFDPAFCLFCMAATIVMFLGVWAAAAALLREKGQIGAFAQAASRSSAAILGIAFATAIYGDEGMVPMMIMAAVPFFNVFAVLILRFSPNVDDCGNLLPRHSGSGEIKKACLDVVKNPLILGIAAGLPFALLRLPVPAMVDGALKSVGGTASPIALLVVGASFSGGQTGTRWKNAMLATLVKLMVLPAIFLPIAAALGFRGSEMVAILIMVGSPTTVASFVMAKNMHADGALTANTILLSTLLSSVSITFWLFLLRSLSLI